MRNARVVGLSPDGMSLIVATDSGDELAIKADDRLRAAVRGDRPRLGQLEIEMETSLSPRDIQTRIRGGATLDEVARVAGIPMDRVERFAAPVLAERDHLAITAMAASVRRRGETSGHRNLRITVTERLVAGGVDIDAIDWDAYRLDDGHWTVTADYAVGEEAKHAEFVYDPRGRFSTAGNDEARRLLGEQSASGSSSDLPNDSEPTVDLSDELALVRATQERPADPAIGPAGSGESDRVDQGTEPTMAVVRQLQSVPQPATEIDDEDEDDEETDAETNDEAPADGSPLTTLHDMLSTDDGSDDPSQGYAGLSATEMSVTEVVVTELTVTELHVAATGDAKDEWVENEPSQPYAGGLSDASAVPETTDAGGFDPTVAVDVPVEPSPAEDAPDPTDQPAAAPASPSAGTTKGPSQTGAEVDEFQLEAEEEAPPVRKPGKKKRASVPSWDDIMFGGPRPPSS